MFFTKDFCEMLSNIKAYQSETASQCFPSQNSPSCYTPGCLFTKRSLLILTSSCHVCLHSHDMLWFYWLDGLGGPLKPPKKENLDSVLKSVSTWSPASVVNLKMWILEIKVPQAKFFEIFKSSISKWVNGLNEPDSPNEIYPPPLETKNILTHPHAPQKKTPKFQSSKSL